VPVTAIAPPVESIDALVSGLSSYLNRDQINGIRRAYYYAEQAHEGQFRRSGEPYVTHPLAVAGILCEMHMDPQSLMAAMLHDVIEDTGITKTAIKSQFGNNVADLVDGVSKLNKITFSSRAEAQAENFQKMAMAMAKELTHHSLPEIGDAFGGRDHTTVLHACRKIRELRDVSPDISEDYQNLLRALTT